MLGHLRGVTEELEGMRVRELAQASSPPPDLPGLDMSAVPPEFFCPITCQMLVDPVVCTDGFTYERCVPACSVPCLSLHVLCHAMFRAMPACSVCQVYVLSRNVSYPIIRALILDLTGQRGHSVLAADQ